MGKCIYCGSEATNLEHPLPRGLGNFKGYVPLADRVCVKCNEECGKLDEQLCRSGIESFFRAYLGIVGRKEHEKVNPFYRGSAGGGPLEMLSANQKTGNTMLLEVLEGDHAKELRYAQIVADDGTTHIVRITDGMTPEEFCKRVSALGIPRFKANVFAPVEDIPWVESLFKEFGYERKVEWSMPDGRPVVYGPSAIKVTVTDRYLRCFAKIGFHYFLTKMTRFRGDEECFSEIRHFIMNPCNVKECQRFVTRTQGQLAWSLDAAYLKNSGHVLSAETEYMNLKANVQMFVGLQSLVYAIHLGRNSSRIAYDESHASFFAYYPKEERAEYDGEVSDLIRVEPT
jgi:hypothetical protein